MNLLDRIDLRRRKEGRRQVRWRSSNASDLEDNTLKVHVLNAHRKRETQDE